MVDPEKGGCWLKEPHVIEQDGIGELSRRNRGGVVDAVPPAKEVQQAMRVCWISPEKWVRTIA